MLDRADAKGQQDQIIQITNEFATVYVRKVNTRNGIRLEITSPKLGHKIRLDALTLESLAFQNKGFFSKCLEEPFGPDDEDI